MGQYHIIANLDKGEVITPHNLGSGLKLWEQLANNPGTGAALIVVLASASNGHGGGDLTRSDSNVIGSWRGDRVAMVGDYDDDSSYNTIHGKMTGAEIYDSNWKDISEAVASVIELELSGKFTGEGWKDWVSDS
jgi:hypothetical protein